MTNVIKTLLVGSHFVPPAKLLIEALPAGAKLLLRAEPENPYDEHAIKVWVESGEVPESQHPNLSTFLPGAGVTIEELLATPEWCLGHVAASGGKPLAKVGLSQGTLEIGEIMANGPYVARLMFWDSGAPGIEVRSKEEAKDGV